MSGRKSLLRIIAEPIVVACVLALAVRAVARIYSVPSASMSPTLRPGDHIVVTRYLSDRPGRGDVVVFHHPAGRELTVKRIVGIPGDLVEGREGQLRISGRVLNEPYATAGESMHIPPQLVPAGYVFVLGDNRTDSWDSRHWGPLPDSLVVGRARIILWSSRPSESGTIVRADAVSNRPPEERARLARVFKWIE
ncbi:MAG TPA: signal peptidase I [Thermoanaerobaculia bacterium]|nr:signal peptidase I [Thermoanaerobaculia bacterium]